MTHGNMIASACAYPAVMLEKTKHTAIIKNALKNDQRIAVINTKSETKKLANSKYSKLSNIQKSEFEDKFGDLYCLHLGSMFQVKLDIDPDDYGRLRIRKIYKMGEKVQTGSSQR